MNLFIVDDIEDYLDSLTLTLSGDWDVSCAVSLKEAITLLEQKDFSVALVDIRLSEEDPTNHDGLVLLDWIRHNHPHVAVVMMSAYRDSESAACMLNSGACRFLPKPINLRDLRAALSEATRRDDD